jgi:hypothetical protein
LRDDQWDAQRGRHNAGACEPSAADKATTGALRGALAARGIVLLDSAICGPRALGFSFRHAESGPILSGTAAYEARQARAGAA